jgi:hypothetical protein
VKTLTSLTIEVSTGSRLLGGVCHNNSFLLLRHDYYI